MLDLCSVIRERLQSVTAGECRRLIVTLPPGHFRTTLTSEYAAQRLRAFAGLKLNVLYATYNTLAAGQVCQRIRDALAPSAIRRSESPLSFELLGGGAFRAVGAGSRTAGFAADLLLVDGLFADWADAADPAVRDAVWDWYQRELAARLKPDAAVVIIDNRWHRWDLIGRALATDPGAWKVFDFAALALLDDPLGRQPGEPLLPSKTWYEDLRDKIGVEQFAALYQQRPMQ